MINFKNSLTKLKVLKDFCASLKSKLIKSLAVDLRSFKNVRSDKQAG